jgi:hypothetical protein
VRDTGQGPIDAVGVHHDRHGTPPLNGAG